MTSEPIDGCAGADASLRLVESRRVGNSGLVVSRLGLGTITWGRDTDEHEARDQLEQFVAAGGTLLDCAPEYGDGEAEIVVGTLLDRVVSRGELVVCARSGVAWRNDVLEHDTSRGSLLTQLDATLRHLGTDHVDLWVVHGRSEGVPVDETLSALDTAVATGRTRYVGVGTDVAWHLAWAVAHQRAWPGRAVPVAVQTEYSLLRRDAELELVPAAQSLGVGVLAVSPLGRGVLTGKYRGGVPADSRAASPHLGPFVRPYLDDRGHGIVEAVATAADGLGLAPLDAALAWVRDRPGVASCVLGARTAAQLRGVLAADEVTLPAEIVTALDDVSDR
jgi:aryl-alcohol dehydrogenase-like predicted oxidoreductase